MNNLEALARDWMIAKAEEEAARVKRLIVEEDLAAALELKSEGAITHTVGKYKITLTQNVNRKLLHDVWAQVQSRCPTALQPVKPKLEADPIGCKWLAANEPQIWASIADAFEIKPAKIGVKVSTK